MSNPNHFSQPDLNTVEMRIARRLLAAESRQKPTFDLIGSEEIAAIVREELLRSTLVRAMGAGHFPDVTRLQWMQGLLGDVQSVLDGEIEPDELRDDLDATRTALSEAQCMMEMLTAEVTRLKGLNGQAEVQE